MKKQMLIAMGLTGALVLAGCETTQPQLQETVNYSSVKYQGQPGQVDYSVRSTEPQQAPSSEPRYLLENKPVQAQNPTPVAAAPAPAPVAAATPAPAPVAAPAPVEEKQPAKVAKVEVEEVEEPKKIIIKQPPRQERIKITGVGYGAQSTYEGFTDGQKRLMAIRASKLDAYRSLAEQLYGIKIDSNTSVATLTAQSDSFRARVNAVVKGARIVSITPMADNNYETVLEVFVDRRFFEDVFVYTGNQHDRVLEPMETCTLGFNCYEAASYR